MELAVCAGSSLACTEHAIRVPRAKLGCAPRKVFMQPESPDFKGKLCSTTVWCINNYKKNNLNFSKMLNTSVETTSIMLYQFAESPIFPAPRVSFIMKRSVQACREPYNPWEIATNTLWRSTSIPTALRGAAAILWAPVQLQLKLVPCYQYPTATNELLISPVMLVGKGSSGNGRGRFSRAGILQAKVRPGHGCIFIF